MNNELMTVIEDQWRKQLHIDEEEEEAERRKREGEKILREGMNGKVDGIEDGTKGSIIGDKIERVDDGRGVLSSSSGKLSIRELNML